MCGGSGRVDGSWPLRVMIESHEDDDVLFLRFDLLPSVSSHLVSARCETHRSVLICPLFFLFFSFLHLP